MSPLDALAPDQRAVIALVLQQGRSYEDIAGMLGLPVAGVRARAHAGLRSLAPDNALPDEITDDQERLCALVRMTIAVR